MHITYCSVCGARVQLKSATPPAEAKCEDCLAGKPPRPSRRGDSALIRRRSTSRMLKQVKNEES